MFWRRHYTVSFDWEQLRSIVLLIQQGDRNILESLSKLHRRTRIMAADFTAFNAALAEVQADVQNVIRKLNEPDVDTQTKIDDATAALRAVNAALDAVAPDPVVTEEPPVEEPAPADPTPPSE